MILDSGASVSVVPPSVGRDYEVVRGEAAMAGVRYEIADGNEIQNLGEKLLPVVTRKESLAWLKGRGRRHCQGTAVGSELREDWPQGGVR